MLTIACVLWIIFAMAVLWSGLPSPYLPKNDEGLSAFYICWFITVFLMFYIHIKLMPISNSIYNEILIDSLMVSVFILVYGIRIIRNRRKIC
jgi:hypothetical protein